MTGVTADTAALVHTLDRAQAVIGKVRDELKAMAGRAERLDLDAREHHAAASEADALGNTAAAASHRQDAAIATTRATEIRSARIVIAGALAGGTLPAPRTDPGSA